LWSWVRACSIVTPDLRRPVNWRYSTPDVSSRGVHTMGVKSCAWRFQKSLNVAGMTPTIWYDSPFSAIERPTAVESAPYLSFQKPYASTTTLL
jgi:hypothetical protein